VVGGPAAFEPFIKAYIEHFALKTCTTDDFKAYYLEHFRDTAAVADIDWETWLYKPGAPRASFAAVKLPVTAW
jgi:leukotriene-A4 hydrolase